MHNDLAIHSGVQKSAFVSFSIVKLAKKIEPSFKPKTKPLCIAGVVRSF